jgi:hypothetical protein
MAGNEGFVPRVVGENDKAPWRENQLGLISHNSRITQPQSGCHSASVIVTHAISIARPLARICSVCALASLGGNQLTCVGGNQQPCGPGLCHS